MLNLIKSQGGRFFGQSTLLVYPKALLVERRSTRWVSRQSRLLININQDWDRAALECRLWQLQQPLNTE
jgi:hypothetical protein